MVVNSFFCLIVEAAECHGPGTLQDMRDIIEKHVQESDVFERATDVMLSELTALKVWTFHNTSYNDNLVKHALLYIFFFNHDSGGLC